MCSIIDIESVCVELHSDKLKIKYLITVEITISPIILEHRNTCLS